MTEISEKESRLGGIVVSGKCGDMGEGAVRSLRWNLETFSEKNVAKTCEREALGGAEGRAGVGNGVGDNLLFFKVGEGWRGI